MCYVLLPASLFNLIALYIKYIPTIYLNPCVFLSISALDNTISLYLVNELIFIASLDLIDISNTKLKFNLY